MGGRVGLGDGSLLSPAFKQAAYLSLGTQLMNPKAIDILGFQAPAAIGKQLNQVEAMSNAPITDQAVPSPQAANPVMNPTTDAASTQPASTENTNSSQSSPLTQGTPGLGG